MAVDLTEFDDGEFVGGDDEFFQTVVFCCVFFFGVAKGAKEKLRFLLIDSR